MTNSNKLYDDRDSYALEPHYSKHVSAMTGEGLYAKSAIAGELAYRDQRIAELEARIRQYEVIAAVAEPLDREELVVAIANCLDGTYYCGRVWSAWQYGTMSEDDFVPVDETDILSELADTVIDLLEKNRKIGADI